MNLILFASEISSSIGSMSTIIYIMIVSMVAFTESKYLAGAANLTLSGMIKT
jgi:hypothetical protein